MKVSLPSSPPSSEVNSQGLLLLLLLLLKLKLKLKLKRLEVPGNQRDFQ